MGIPSLPVSATEHSPSSSSSVSPPAVSAPFPPLPFELVHLILIAASHCLYYSDFNRDDTSEQKKVYKFLRNARLVCKDFEHVVSPLLYRNVLVTNPRHATHLLEALLLKTSRVSLIQTFEWPIWDHRDEVVVYPVVTKIRAQLAELLLPSPALIECIFPTVPTSILDLIANTPPTHLRTLGTVLTVQNGAMSRLMASPFFRSLESLSIWWGDASTGSLFLPTSLRSLRVRCDHFLHGNHLPFAPLSSGAHPLPHLTYLAFSFTNQVYANAPLPPKIPLLLSSVGPNIQHLALRGDPASSWEVAALPEPVLHLCPKLKILELQNHRLGSRFGHGDGSPSLERIHYRFDPFGDLIFQEVHDVGALYEMVEVVTTRRHLYPKLHTILLLGVPEEVEGRWESLLLRVAMVEWVGVLVLDQRGRGIKHMLPSRIQSSKTRPAAHLSDCSPESNLSDCQADCDGYDSSTTVSVASDSASVLYAPGSH